MAIGRNLECRTKRSPEPAHFRNIGHHFSLFDAAPHLFEEGIRLLHLLSQGNERRDPDWFSVIHRFQSLLGDQIMLDEFSGDILVVAGSINIGCTHADKRSRRLVAAAWDGRNVEVDPGFIRLDHAQGPEIIIASFPWLILSSAAL